MFRSPSKNAHLAHGIACLYLSSLILFPESPGFAQSCVIWMFKSPYPHVHCAVMPMNTMQARDSLSPIRSVFIRLVLFDNTEHFTLYYICKVNSLVFFCLRIICLPIINLIDDCMTVTKILLIWSTYTDN